MALTPKQRKEVKEVLEKGHAVNLSPNQQKFKKPVGARGLFSQTVREGNTEEIPAHPMTDDQWGFGMTPLMPSMAGGAICQNPLFATRPPSLSIWIRIST
jgi:hypothetical protein